MNTMYGYQVNAAKVAFKNLLSPRYIASVLAACPGAGKTTISHHVINKYIAQFPKAKIVVLTEGQKILKEQYLDELRAAHIPLNFTYGEFGSAAQVQVGIPQSILKLDWNEIDLLVVDEAHHFYFADLVQGIISTFKPKHTLLMTGSPTEFNLYNERHDKKFGIHYIPADFLQKLGVFSKIVLDVVRVADKANPVEVTHSALQTARTNGDDLSKIMVACPTIEFAMKVAGVLTSFGYIPALSTSENDQDNEEIKKFKKGEANALIVVGKGILGFNDGNMTTMFDFKSSENLDGAYQLFARMLRRHPKQLTKAYYRVGDRKDYNKQVLTLHKITALMKGTIFAGFTGKNLKLEINT